MNVLIYVAPSGSVDRIYESELVELKKSFDRVILLNYKNTTQEQIEEYVDGCLLDNIQDPQMKLSFKGQFAEELSNRYNADIV